MRKILVSNDDGIESEGLVRLAVLAKKFGEVWVVAPAKQFSAKSHSTTFWEPVDVWPVDFPVEGVHAYCTSGTPADCVAIGLSCIVPDGPDVVFCGIGVVGGLIFFYRAGLVSDSHTLFPLHQETEKNRKTML